MLQYLILCPVFGLVAEAYFIGILKDFGLYKPHKISWFDFVRVVAIGFIIIIIGEKP